MLVQQQSQDVALPVVETDTAPLRDGAAEMTSAKPCGRMIFWLEICLLLGIAQVLLAGYQLGVGNQSIQIPFLKHAANPTLYANDAMVQTTRQAYPSWFFTLMGLLGRAWNVVSIYATAQIFTSIAVFAAAYALARTMFASAWPGLVLMLMLLAGHHRALGGDELYSTGFTHTFAVFPAALAAVALGYSGRYLAAFIVAGVLFNLHALTAGYAMVFVTACALADVQRWPGFAASLRALMRPLLAFFLCALPTLACMVFQAQHFDESWLNLMRIRSGDHSFPSSWWQPGNADLPRLALLAGLGILAMSFGGPRGRQRKTWLILLAAAGLFFVGYWFTEQSPWATIVRAQLFRASRIVLVIVMARIAHGAVRAWMLARDGTLPRWHAWAEAISASFTVLVISVPALIGLLPAAFVIALIVAIVNARLSWVQATVSGAALLVCLLAWRELRFPLVALGWSEITRGVAALADMPTPFWVAMVGALALAAASLLPMRRWMLAPLSLLAVLVWCVLLAGVQPWLAAMGLDGDPWVDVQRWAKANTPRDAVFLTPTQPGGFRIHSERAVVGEWRDGTQLYFSADFAPIWWERMIDLQPGLLTDDTGARLHSRGLSIDSLDDRGLVELAEKYGARYIVLPAGSERQLECVYANAGYAVYLSKTPQVHIPDEVVSAEIWQAQQQFMRDVVLPNIEKCRKSDAVIQVVDSDGRPVYDLPIEVNMTRQSFAFSASLPFFAKPNDSAARGDYKPPPVDPRELERFKEIFNHNMIAFSGKWMYIEPEEGKRDYAELDQHVAWCVENGIRMQFHFVSGYMPTWMHRKPAQQRGEPLLRHARQLVERYGDKMESWQVVNEVQLLQDSPAVFREMRNLLPNAKLGIADCSRFWSDGADEQSNRRRRNEMFRGLPEIRWLKEQGIQVDFFGFHGHRPFALWPDVREMYRAMDTFHQEGVKLHITELTAPMGEPIVGPVRRGTLTPELQADLYKLYYTVCYSHPGVEMINLFGIGPHTWQSGAGLLDEQYNPKPAFEALRKLIREDWWTNAGGRLALDGTFRFRGFHGDYRATITLPDGQTRSIELTLSPGQSTHMRVQFDPAGQTLRVISSTTRPAQ